MRSILGGTVLGLFLSQLACATPAPKGTLVPNVRVPDAHGPNAQVPESAPAQREIGTLIQPQTRLTAVPPSPDSCWQEQHCTTNQRCWLGPLPCGPAGCREMRQAASCEEQGDGICREWESCIVASVQYSFAPAPYGQCRITPCQNASDCRSTNQTCAGGLCQMRTCQSSEDCDGYCIDGKCSTVPGRCVNSAELMVQ